MTDYYDATVKRLVAEVESLRRDMERSKGLHSPFMVLNEGTMSQLLADQNDYDPQNYDVLRMSSDANRVITGISGGKQGRLLRIIDIGVQQIQFAHMSALSIVTNRIICPAGVTVTLGTLDSAQLYYDGVTLMWRIVVPSA